MWEDGYKVLVREQRGQREQRGPHYVCRGQWWKGGHIMVVGGNG